MATRLKTGFIPPVDQSHIRRFVRNAAAAGGERGRRREIINQAAKYGVSVGVIRVIVDSRRTS